MATLFIPTPSGGRKAITIDKGASITHTLGMNECLNAAARWGLEKKTGTTWTKVPLSYRPQDTDELRVAFPQQHRSHAADGLAKMLTTLLKSLKRKTHAPSGTRTRRK